MITKLNGQFFSYLFFLSFEIANSFGGNPLNGKCLRVLSYPYFDLVTLERNASSHVISFDGIMKHYLEQLGIMNNFSYYILPDDPPTMEAIFAFIAKGEADMILAPILGTRFRFQFADFPTPFNDDTGFACVVAYPKEKFSLIASLTPLSYKVWVLLVSGAVAITVYLRFSEFGVSRWFKSKTDSKSFPVGDTNRQITNFVLGNLVSQGQRYSSTQMAVRIAAGAWCAGCFFLVQIYCSTLTSHLMSPNQKPIINSVNDLPNTPGVGMTGNKGFGLELILRDTTLGTRNMKLLSNKLFSDPRFLCNTTAECLTIVDEGQAAYCNAMTSLKTVLGNDLKTTGTCNYLAIKDTFLNSFAYTPLQKNSPYTEFISRGIMILKQSGLYNQWISWYLPTPWQCMKLPSHKGSLRRISISNFSSAFTILFMGYILSIVAFCYEKTKYWFSVRTYGGK